MTSTRGLTSQADSPWPMSGDVAATTASAPDTFMILKKNQVKTLMSHYMTPREYIICTKAMKKMVDANYTGNKSESELKSLRDKCAYRVNTNRSNKSPVFRGEEEAELEHKEANNRGDTISVTAVL